MSIPKKTKAEEIQDSYYNQTFGSTELIVDENDMYVPAESEYVDLGEETEEYIIGGKNGLWENIKKKKEREGKNYKPAKVGDPDRPTKDQIKDAQALQYGKPSKNDPRKTPAPNKDKKKGSKKNKPDSAKDDKGSIKFSKETVAKLSNLVTKHNSNNKGSRATLGMLKAVYRRGAGAFSTSHHPNMSREGWAIARVNAFLYLMRNGRPSNPNYKQDNDLLPKSHPRSSKASDDSSMQIAQINKMHDQLMSLVKILESIPIEFEDWTKDKISKADHYIEEIYNSVFYSSKTDKHSEDETEEPSEMEGPETDALAAEKPSKKVTLNKPFRTPKGPKKFSVYVKNDKGNVVKVNFGDPNMSIKRDDPERRKSFRARHQCDTSPGPKWKARYWSCRFWSKTDVSDLA